MLSMPLFKSFFPSRHYCYYCYLITWGSRTLHEWWRPCMWHRLADSPKKPTNAMATNGDHKQNGNVGNLSLKTTTKKKQLKICRNSQKSSSLDIWVSIIQFQLPCHRHHILPTFFWEEKAYGKDLLWGPLDFWTMEAHGILVATSPKYSQGRLQKICKSLGLRMLWP